MARLVLSLLFFMLASPALAQEEGASEGASDEAASDDDDASWESVLDAYEDDCTGDDCAEETVDTEPEPAEPEPAGLVLPLFGDTTFGLTSTTRGAYRIDNYNANRYDDNLAATQERLELSAQGEHLRLSLRLDASVPIGQEECPPGMEALCRLRTDVRPERIALHGQFDDVSFDLGDSHIVFGRGVVLALRKVDILGVDDALRGAAASYDGGGIWARALGGISNPQNLDPISLEIVDDPIDVFAGGEAGIRVFDRQLELSGRFVRTWFEEDPSTGRDVTADVAGYGISFPHLFDGHLVLYGEAAAMRRVTVDDAGDETRSFGRAVYGQAQLVLGDLSTTLEWKDYRDFQLSVRNGELRTYRIYSAAPTLDRDTERFRANYNSRGAHLQVNYAFAGTPYALAMHGIAYGHSEEDDVDPWDGILVTHGYVSASKQADTSGSGELGWLGEIVLGARRESYLHDPMGDPGQGDLDWSVFHGELDATLAGGDHSLELRVEHRIERRYVFDYTDYVRGGVTLTYSYVWALNGQIDISPVLLWNDEKKELPSLYPGLEVRLEFAQGSFVRIFGGRTPGGRLCSGGVCRDVPPFEGVQGELIVRL